MARIKLTLIGSTGVILREVDESMVLSSADAIYTSLSELLKALAVNFRKLDTTGKIPMDPIELSPKEVNALSDEADDDIKPGGTD